MFYFLAYFILLSILATLLIHYRFIKNCTKWVAASLLIYFLILSPSILVVLLWISRNKRHRIILPFGISLVGKIIGIKNISIDGQENMVQSGAVILVNHQSILDLLVLGRILQTYEDCVIISKKENRIVDPLGFFGWLWGVVYVDRKDRNMAICELDNLESEIRNKNVKVIVFPEGTRNRSNKLLPFKKGPFHLALNASCAIQPVAVERYSFLTKNEFKPGVIKIHILPPVLTDGYFTHTIDKLIEETYNSFCRTLDEA